VEATSLLTVADQVPFSDNHQRVCFSLAMWNGKDKILKERLFGLTGQQGMPLPSPFERTLINAPQATTVKTSRKSTTTSTRPQPTRT
jgi:hypothetical protein